MSIFMKIDGIDGEATEASHTKWIECNSLQFGFGRGISTPQGNAAHRETSSPSVSELTITKEMDISSYKLFASSLTEVEGKTVKIDMCRTGGKSGLITYANYELTNALISGYSVSSGGDRPSESLSLNFTKIKYTYTNFDANNKAGTAMPVQYDLSDTTQS